MNTDQNGRVELGQEIKDKIMRGESVRLTAPDVDMGEKKSSSLKAKIQGFNRSHASHLTVPFADKVGVELTIQLNALPMPWHKRHIVVEMLEKSGLTFSEKTEKTTE